MEDEARKGPEDTKDAAEEVMSYSLRFHQIEFVPCHMFLLVNLMLTAMVSLLTIS